jgi:predicted O-methyltransferase YrrM
MNDIEQIKQKAIENHIPIIMDDTLEKVGELLEELKPIKILEIGTAVGYSAIRFSKYLQENGYIDTIERDEERIKEAKQNIKDMELEGTIHIFEGDALEILPTLKGPYDMVFIDAAKGKYPIFLQEALRMLKVNGIIIGDNVLYKGYVMSDYNKHKQRTAVRGLRQFLKDLEENENLETKLLEVGDGLIISKKIK